MSGHLHEAPSPVRDPRDRRARDRRWWAAVIDVWLVSWLVGGATGALVTVPMDTQTFGALIVAPLLMAAEARTGRTPGKAIVGVQTRRVGGGVVGWRSAAVRRSWMLAPVVGLIPGMPPAAGELLFLVALVGLVVSMARDPDGRGWHDRVADTEVVAAVVSRRPAVVTGLVVAGILLIAVDWRFGAPSVQSTSFRSMPDVEAVRCSVVHDGWLYPRHQRNVVLTPGSEALTGRFGPHQVTLELLDDDGEHGGRGLQIRVAGPGMTTGRSEGTGDRATDVTTGPGLGELTIDCRPDAPS